MFDKNILVSNIIRHLREAKTKTTKHRYELTKCPDSGNWTKRDSGASNVFSSRSIRCKVLQGSPTLNDSTMIPRKLWQLVRRIWRKPDAMKITSCTAAKAHEPLSTKDTRHTTSSQKHILQTYASEMWPTLFVVCSAYPTILLYTKVSHSNQKTVKIITRLILNAPQASMMTSRKKNPSCKLKATLPNLNHSPTNFGMKHDLSIQVDPPTLFFLRINVSMMSFQGG